MKVERARLVQKLMFVRAERLGSLSDRCQPGSGFPLAQRLEGHDGRQQLRPRLGFPGLPVVDRLSGRSHQKPTVVGRQLEPFSLCRERLRAEAHGPR
jgi:hypothetical protein